MKRITAFLSLICLCIASYADYIIVSRNANIREEPASESEIVYKAQRGEYLLLLDSLKQYNGYYYIQTRDGMKGYIYRTLVRRYHGSLPSDAPDRPEETEAIGYGQAPADYYAGTADLTGERLKARLHTIIRNHKVFSYDELWDILAATDQDVNNPANVILIYSGRSQSAEQRDRGTNYNYLAHGFTLNDSWNREHIWAKSHGFSNETDTPYTDIHHIRPSDRSTNSARNTRSFDNCLKQYFDNGGTVQTDCYTSDTEWKWEPPDNEKGDIARMIFYMDVRYEGPVMDLEIVDYLPDKGTKEKIMGKLSALKEWHKQDPVDDRERKRNQIIYQKYQGNRNPFIDHPEWVSLIWGN
jgi:endonuclease I